MNNLKYKCDFCKFYTNSLTAWEKHEETEKHKSGGIKRKIRRDKRLEEILKCDLCEYENKRKYCLDNHILNNHSTKNERKEKYKYYCDKCDFGTFSKQRYEEHLMCQTHIE
jgi:hypothetical protein